MSWKAFSNNGIMLEFRYNSGLELEIRSKNKIAEKKLREIFKIPELSTIPHHSRQKAASAETVSDYIDGSIEKNHTVFELARRFHVSESCLQNAFRRAFGMPVGSYVRNRKMKRAAELLIGTDLPIAEIAGKVGYDNPGKFSAAFKKELGTSPKDYRKAQK